MRDVNWVTQIISRTLFSGKKVRDPWSDRKSDRDTFDQRWSGRYNFAGVMDGKSYFKEILPNSFQIKTENFIWKNKKHSNCEYTIWYRTNLKEWQFIYSIYDTNPDRKYLFIKSEGLKRLV